MTSDPLRTDPTATVNASSGVERDAKIEQLLLAGLDHYFASQYEQAINIWTRALFFDRNHARARAYIERARRAQAERQRESEELLHNGAVAYRRGDGREARRLLQAALDAGAPFEDTFPMLERLNQLDAATPAPAILRARNVTHAAPGSVLDVDRPRSTGVAHVRIRADRHDGPGRLRGRVVSRRVEAVVIAHHRTPRHRRLHRRAR